MYRLCLKCGSWETFPVLAVNAPLVVALTARPGMQRPALHSGSCWKKIQAMGVERAIVHFETWRRGCRAPCRSLLPRSSNTALQPGPWGWCRLTVDDWGVSFISIIWCDSCCSVLCGGKEVEQRPTSRSALWGQLLIELQREEHSTIAFSFQCLPCPMIYAAEPRRQLKKLGRSLVSLALLLHGNDLQGNKVKFTFTGCCLQLVAHALGQHSSNLAHRSCSLIPTFLRSVSPYAFSQQKCWSL